MAKDNELNKTLARMGEHIRKARESVGASQQELGNILGYSRDGISKIENGHSNIGLYQWCVLIAFLEHAMPDDPAVTVARAYLGRRPRHKKD